MAEEEYLVEKKVEYILNMRLKKILEAIEASQKEIRQLKDDVSVLKNKVERLNLGIERPKVQQAFGEKEEPKKEVKKEDSNSRTGDWKPGDVSIEKMFYYGNKQK